MFSPDSRIMQFLGRFADLVLLNIVFLLTCLPVFTIGAAVTAMYSLTFQMMREEARGIWKSYFCAFKANFRQSTLCWGLTLFLIVPGLIYFDRLFQMGGLLRWLCLPFLLIVLICLMMVSYLFPWISQFENTTRQALQNALIFSISHLPRTVCILVVNLLPVVLWAVNLDLFLQISFLWLSLYFAAAAYINTGLLWHVFKPYRNP